MKPALVGAGLGAAVILSPVFTVESATSVPPCEAQVTVKSSVDQIAYIVKLAVNACTNGNPTTSPASEVAQPWNVKPALVGAVGGEAIASSALVVVLPTLEPPCEAQVTVKSFAVHLAYKVKLAV